MSRTPLNTLSRLLAFLLAPTALLVAGCGGRVIASNASSSAHISIQASASTIDTNGTTRYTATQANGSPANVEWTVSGGDPIAGPGTISPTGLYTPPSYLTQEEATVAISASGTLSAASPSGQPSIPDTAILTVTPGFLQPLTPENLALGAGGTVTISGSMTEVGGSGGIRFTLSTDPTGTPSKADHLVGTLSGQHCKRGSVTSTNPAYTICTVNYTAPSAISTASSIYIVGTVANAAAHTWTRILLNPAGITSNPATHQAHLALPVLLGSSSGSNADYDSSQGILVDCCGGTLGALLQDNTGTQYVLSNNHVFARSDQSIPGETVIQPALIDNACVPFGFGAGTTPIATLTGYPALSAASTNVDAAIARVTHGAVDPRGNILELGTRQPDGTLAPAPPGISSTAGKGETATLGMSVSKSGRTTGLTCAAVSAISVDVTVDYFTDCAETTHSLSKTFTNQIAIAGANFSDAGDSGALVVDTLNAEPVGLFFAGGTDDHGIEHAIANPVSDVLSALNTQIPNQNGSPGYSFVGAQDHAVSCLNYSDQKSFGDKPFASLPLSERERLEAALPQAQQIAQQLAQQAQSPGIGIPRVTPAASKDHPGEAAIAFYLDSALLTNASLIPATIGGVPTRIVSSSDAVTSQQPRSASLQQAIAIKQRNAPNLMKSDLAIFGVGVAQSLDSPSEAAIVLYVDRHRNSGKLPEQVEGQRVRVILMDRLHVTRAHGQALSAAPGCPTHGKTNRETNQDREDGSFQFPQAPIELP